MTQYDGEHEDELGGTFGKGLDLPQHAEVVVQEGGETLVVAVAVTETPHRELQHAGMSGGESQSTDGKTLLEPLEASCTLQSDSDKAEKNNSCVFNEGSCVFNFPRKNQEVTHVLGNYSINCHEKELSLPKYRYLYLGRQILLFSIEPLNSHWSFKSFPTIQDNVVNQINNVCEALKKK